LKDYDVIHMSEIGKLSDSVVVKLFV